jgi:hypothetical protein
MMKEEQLEERVLKKVSARVGGASTNKLRLLMAVMAARETSDWAHKFR